MRVFAWPGTVLGFTTAFRIGTNILSFVTLCAAPLAMAQTKPRVPEPAQRARRSGIALSLPNFETRDLAGWTVHINRDLFANDGKATAKAIELLGSQLDEITRVVPAAAVKKLRRVQLWISPEYPNSPPRAEYHPNVEWLRENGRNPAMAKGVEFTNVRIFDAETRRMPNFTLHELSHAYHDRELKDGFANKEIKTAYARAKASGNYDRVERKDANGRKSTDRAYAMTDPQEYFAESTEAFFCRNDFFPYIRAELEQHDPRMAALLIKLWGVKAKAS